MVLIALNVSPRLFLFSLNSEDIIWMSGCFTRQHRKCTENCFEVFVISSRVRMCHCGQFLVVLLNGIYVRRLAYQKTFVQWERRLVHVILFQKSDQFLFHFCFISFTSNQSVLLFESSNSSSKFNSLRFNVELKLLKLLNYSSGFTFSPISSTSFCILLFFKVVFSTLMSSISSQKVLHNSSLTSCGTVTSAPFLMFAVLSESFVAIFRLSDMQPYILLSPGASTELIWYILGKH